MRFRTCHDTAKQTTYCTCCAARLQLSQAVADLDGPPWRWHCAICAGARLTNRADGESIEAVLEAQGLKQHTPCGLNASWSSSAWHLGPSDKPNWNARDLYLIDTELDGPRQFWLVRTLREPTAGSCNTGIETLAEGSFNECAQRAKQELRRE